MLRKLMPFLLLPVLSSTVAADHHDGWVSMFNGRTLAGWTQKNGHATYAVVNGAIVGTTSAGSPNSFLCTVRQYGDFELEFEVAVSNLLNSGVQIRSQTRDEPGKHTLYQTGRVNGPQVEIEASGPAGALSGFVYGEATGRGWLSPEDRRVPHTRFKNGEWNKYRIIAQGPRIQTFINGEKIEDLTDEAIYETHPRGFIGLQVHGVGDRQLLMHAMWRNLRIKELD